MIYPDKYTKHLMQLLTLLFCFTMLAKCTYKILGYGTEPHPATMVVYWLTAISLVVTIPYLIYRYYFLKDDKP